MRQQLIIFTDLDGTLLDRRSYSFEPALPSLALIKQKAIPLVLSSSKTRAEIEFYRNRLENGHPFISENGGAVFVPKGYFSFSFRHHKESEGDLILQLGMPYRRVVEALDSIMKETGIPIKGFSALSEEEIASLTGLELEQAKRAKRREHDEPFLVEGGEMEIETVKRKIDEKGMDYAWGGKFHHILGKHDKGKAVEFLKQLFENQFLSIATVGIGDSLNDLAMLEAVDHPILLKDKGDPLPKSLSRMANLTVVEGSGPEAWNKAMIKIVQ